ncbi:MAG: J domain-containing protein [Paludibacteraceae bacterium]|nr:J domain-containing protein [Paludibacteraceae bacterium]
MGLVVSLLAFIFICVVFMPVSYMSSSKNKDKAEKNDLKLQTHCANLISAMLVYNREITAAKRKLIDDVIDRAKICGSLSNSEYWNLVVKQIYEPSDLNKSINFIAHNLPLDERMKISHLLFKLSIEDDGIMNDEWKLLRTVVNGMNFSKTYIDHLFNFYGPLRSYSDTAIYNRVHGFVKQRKKVEPQSGNTGKARGASASARAKGGTSSSYNRSSEQARSRTGSAGASAGGASQKAAPKVADSRLVQYYAVLGLPASASLREVQDAYHRLALLHHPDLPKNADRQEECVAQMAKINTAYRAIANSFN